MVITPDGESLVEPTDAELAAKVGLATTPSKDFYDLIVVGGGPAGLGAAVYGASEGLRTVLVERTATGGQAGQSSRIENYLGFPDGVSGAQLTDRARRQAAKFGAEVLTTRNVMGLEVCGSARKVTFEDGTSIDAHTVILATGVSYRRLDAPGVEELIEGGQRALGERIIPGVGGVDGVRLPGDLASAGVQREQRILRQPDARLLHCVLFIDLDAPIAQAVPTDREADTLVLHVGGVDHEPAVGQATDTSRQLPPFLLRLAVGCLVWRVGRVAQTVVDASYNTRMHGEPPVKVCLASSGRLVLAGDPGAFILGPFGGENNEN